MYLNCVGEGEDDFGRRMLRVLHGYLDTLAASDGADGECRAWLVHHDGMSICCRYHVEDRQMLLMKPVEGEPVEYSTLERVQACAESYGRRAGGP
jgi:hypothetical protein